MIISQETKSKEPGIPLLGVDLINLDSALQREHTNVVMAGLARTLRGFYKLLNSMIYRINGFEFYEVYVLRYEDLK